MFYWYLADTASSCSHSGPFCCFFSKTTSFLTPPPVPAMQTCLSSAHWHSTTMAAVILLTVTHRAFWLPIPLLSSLNHWNQQDLHTNWPKVLWQGWTLVPVMQRLKGGFDLAGERTTFISRQITLFSSAFFWSYRLCWEGAFRWDTQIRLVRLSIAAIHMVDEFANENCAVSILKALPFNKNHPAWMQLNKQNPEFIELVGLNEFLFLSFSLKQPKAAWRHTCPDPSAPEEWLWRRGPGCRAAGHWDSRGWIHGAQSPYDAQRYESV